MLWSKQKYGRHKNVTETNSTDKSISFIPEAFKNKNYEIHLYKKYHFEFVSGSESISFVFIFLT